MKNIKIFKSANNMSTLDVQSNLNYHKMNKSNEDVYKGSIAIAITETNGSKYLNGYLPKSMAKVVFNAIVDRNFHQLFPEGFTQFGGSNKDGKIRSRSLKITIGKNKAGVPQYIFNISEGPGKMTETGAFQPAGKPDIYVTKYILHIEAMQMAYEVLDFIRLSEDEAVRNGKPLFTIMPERNADVPAGKTFNKPSQPQQQRPTYQKPRQNVPFANRPNEAFNSLSDNDLPF